MRHALILLSLLAPLGGVAATEPELARQRELIHLVRQDCGSCHGMNMTGGLGLPLTPQALRERPFDGMVATVVHGRPGTAMPPWRGIVTEGEAEWIVRQLLAGLPEAGR